MFTQLKQRIKRKLRNILGIAEIENRLDLTTFKQKLDFVQEEIAKLRNTAKEIKISIENSKHSPPHKNYHLDKEDADRGIFIVGHGRSGTTILTDALNFSSKDIYLLSEADLHNNDMESNIYLERYNEQTMSYYYAHYSPHLKNMRYNYTSPKFFMPTKIGIYNTGWSVLSALFREYKYVGAKISFGLYSFDNDGERNFINFYSSYFHRSNYICVFRDLEAVIDSCMRVFPENRDDQKKHSRLLYSIAMSYWVVISLYLMLPNVYVVRHNRISSKTFSFLGEKLKINLDDSISLYSNYADGEQKYRYSLAQYEGYQELLSVNRQILANIDSDMCSFRDKKLVLDQYNGNVQDIVKFFREKLESV